MTARQKIVTVTQAVTESTGVFVRDVGYGLLAVSHSMLALLGLVVVAVAVFGAGHTELRMAAEQHIYDWLQERQDARAEADDNTLAAVNEPDAVARATAIDPSDLPRQQAVVASWLSRRYRVAPEPVSRLVQEAWSAGQRAQLDPTLILAIMAVESSFNPFAQSQVGAQGLMQVMTRVHDDKYEAFGGQHAAFDPVTGRVTLTCSTQMPHLMRTAIADLIGMPESDLRVLAAREVGNLLVLHAREVPDKPGDGVGLLGRAVG